MFWLVDEISQLSLILGVALIIVAAIIVWVVLYLICIVRPTEKGLVTRFGKYHHSAKGGITFIYPAAAER